MKPVLVLKSQDLVRHAKRIANACGCSVVTSRASNPTLVHHGLAPAARWHILTHEPPRRPIADLYVHERPAAHRIARLLAHQLGVYLDLLDNTATPADLKAHPSAFVSVNRRNPSRSKGARASRSRHRAARRGLSRRIVRAATKAVRRPAAPGNAAQSLYYLQHHQARSAMRRAGLRPNPKGRKSALGVPEKHQLRIARATLRMRPEFVRIMGGPSIEEAREIIYRLTGRRENPRPSIRDGVAILLDAGGFKVDAMQVRKGKVTPMAGLSTAISRELSMTGGPRTKVLETLRKAIGLVERAPNPKGHDPELDEAVRRIRTGLHRRGGERWSVTRGTGSVYGWIYIKSPRGDMNEDEQRYLAKLLGLDTVHHQGVMIPSGSTARDEYVARAEGRAPRPSPNPKGRIYYIESRAGSHFVIEGSGSGRAKPRIVGTHATEAEALRHRAELVSASGKGSRHHNPADVLPQRGHVYRIPGRAGGPATTVKVIGSKIIEVGIGKTLRREKWMLVSMLERDGSSRGTVLMHPSTFDPSEDLGKRTNPSRSPVARAGRKVTRLLTAGSSRIRRSSGARRRYLQSSHVQRAARRIARGNPTPATLETLLRRARAAWERGEKKQAQALYEQAWGYADAPRKNARGGGDLVHLTRTMHGRTHYLVLEDGDEVWSPTPGEPMPRAMAVAMQGIVSGAKIVPAGSAANPKGRNPSTMTLTAHQVTEFSRAAKAMYARGENALGHLLSAVAAKRVVPLSQYDQASKAYRAWLVFDEPKPSPRRAANQTRPNPRMAFAPGERVSVPYTGRSKRLTHEKATVLGETTGGISVQVRHGKTTEQHTFPPDQVRRLPARGERAKMGRLGRAKDRMNLKALRARVKTARADAVRYQRAFACAEALAKQSQPYAGEVPSAEYRRQLAAMRRHHLEAEASESIAHDLERQDPRWAEAPDPFALVANCRRRSLSSRGVLCPRGRRARRRAGCSAKRPALRSAKRAARSSVLRNPSHAVEKAERTFRNWQDRGPITVRHRRLAAPRPLKEAAAELGKLVSVTYRTDKYDGKVKDHEHVFDPPLASLVTDPDGQDLHVVRGASRYRITSDGITH